MVDDEYDCVVHQTMKWGKTVRTRNSVVRRTRDYVATFDSCPLISLRKTAWRKSLYEFEWFMSGSDNINDLHDSVKNWWSPWVSVNGTIHYNYGRELRHFCGDMLQVDQINYLLNGVKNHPFSRRNCITTWNTADMTYSLTPITNCHGSWIQVLVEDEKVYLSMVQRSVDVICGLPHNWFQYWGFLMWLCHHSGFGVGSFTWHGVDVHIYESHFPLAEKILAATLPENYKTPTLKYNPPEGVTDFKADHFSLEGEYSPVLLDRAEMIV